MHAPPVSPLPATSAFAASAAIFIAASVWGLYWVPLRWLEAAGLGGLWAVAAFNTPPALILGALVLTRWPQTRPTLGTAALIGLFTGGGMALYAGGLILAPVIRATLFFYLAPVWGTLAGLLWLNERMDWRRWVALTGGLVGVMLLVSGNAGGAPLGLGDLFALLSGIAWIAGATLIVRNPDVPVVSTAGGQFAGAVLVALALHWLFGLPGGSDPGDLRPMLHPLPLLSSLIIMATVVTIFWAQRHVSPGRAGLLMMSEVLVAVASASLLLPDEAMSPLAWLGAALIIGACLVEVSGDAPGAVTA